MTAIASATGSVRPDGLGRRGSAAMVPEGLFAPGVDVARHQGHRADLGLGDCAGDSDRAPNLDLVEGDVAEVGHRCAPVAGRGVPPGGGPRVACTGASPVMEMSRYTT